MKEEVANPTNYEVEILREPYVLKNILGVGNNFADVVKYRCETCSLPTRALKYVNQTIYGPPRKVAFSSDYQDVSFSFMATDSMKEKEYFALWQTGIVNNDVNNPYANENINNVTYYDDYIGEIAIKVYKKNGSESYRVTFYEAYPIVVQETPLSWNSNNDYIRVTVMIAYKYFVEERYESSSVANRVISTNPSVNGSGGNSTIPDPNVVIVGIPTKNNTKVDNNKPYDETVIIPHRLPMPGSEAEQIELGKTIKTPKDIFGKSIKIPKIIIK